jgi:cobalt/nickel transport system permease protein
MHIPDGYLSPQTAGAFYVVCAPLWAFSVRNIRRHLKARSIPLLALLSAFSFLIMMFNIPLPGGTTAHALGAVLIAILVGPWPALMAMTVALAVQALFFGDGGIIAFGANVFNCGFTMPMAGYLVFAALKGRSSPGDRRFAVAAAAGGFAGINVAALLVALELGLQPMLYHTASGTPLYSPFPFSVTLPAMMTAHLTVAGGAEALLTGGIVAFLGKNHAEIFATRANRADVGAALGDCAHSSGGAR